MLVNKRKKRSPNGQAKISPKTGLYHTTVALRPEVFYRLKALSVSFKVSVNTLVNQAVKRTMETDKDYLREVIASKELELQHLKNKMSVILVGEQHGIRQTTY